MTVDPEEIKNEPVEEKKEEEKDSKASKITETIDTLKKNENIEGIINYAQSNTQDTIAYVLMVVGILWMIFNEFYGGMLVGVVFGFYFSKEIIDIVKSCDKFIETQGVAKSMILGGAVLALLLTVPGIIIGAALTTGLKMLLVSEK